MDNVQLEQKVGKLENNIVKVSTTVDEHTRLLNAQSEKNDVLTRLTVLLEREMSDSKERERRQELRDEAQNKQLENFSITLNKVNENLTNLNNRQEQLNNSQHQLGERVDHIENTLKEHTVDKTKIVISVLKWLGGLATTVLGAYLLYKWGISGGIQH